MLYSEKIFNCIKCELIVYLYYITLNFNLEGFMFSGSLVKIFAILVSLQF